MGWAQARNCHLTCETTTFYIYTQNFPFKKIFHNLNLQFSQNYHLVFLCEYRDYKNREVALMKQHIFNGTVAVLGAIFSYLFGGWTPLLGLFFFVIVLDYLSGLGAAVVSGQGLSSAIGFKGLVKKFALVAIVALSNQLDKVMGTDVIMYGSIYFFIANELISIVENYGRMKLPLPPYIKSIIRVLKSKGE